MPERFSKTAEARTMKMAERFSKTAGSYSVNVGIRIEHRGDSVIVGVIGDLDLATAPDLRSQILRQLDDEARFFVIDLTACEFIDSIGLGTLIGCLRRIRSAEGRLELVVPFEKQRRIFELCDLDRVFTLHADVDAAHGFQERTA